MDPLRLDLNRQTSKLLEQLPLEYSAALKNASSRAALLDLLSALLLMPQYTMTVATLYRPILVDLCARWMHQDTDGLLKFEALCLLLEVHSELYPYVLMMTSTLCQTLGSCYLSLPVVVAERRGRIVRNVPPSTAAPTKSLL